MSALLEIKPTEQHRVMDLVSAAGVDVSDWKNMEGGEKNAAWNPKYCYEWAFVEPKAVVVLNLWYEAMLERAGAVVQDINFRRAAKKLKPIWQKRAIRMDVAVQTAYRDKLPIRVVICDGKRRTDDSDSQEPSEVKARLLDPLSWAVTAYDWETGAGTLTRGAKPAQFVDQFLIQEETQQPVERREVTGQAFVRDPEVRRKVLSRANGKCEWCSQPGFAMANGSVYLETHHVVPLCEDGADAIKNVVALCPNHHREAHHGLGREAMRKLMLERLAG